MALVLVAMDDVQARAELAALVEKDGHDVTVVAAVDAEPTPGLSPDILVVDGDDLAMDISVVAASWKRHEAPPALLVLASTAVARLAGERARGAVVAKPVSLEVLVSEIDRLAGSPRGVPAPTPATALRLLGLAGGGLPEDEAAAIIAGVPRIDIGVIREALRAHAWDYVAATDLLPTLLQRRRLLGHDEAVLARSLDGARTMRGVIDGGDLPTEAAARVLWALIAGGAAELCHEPPPVSQRARRVAMARDHLRARRAVIAETAHHYQVLELAPQAKDEDVHVAARHLAGRFAPATVAGLDLGDVGGLAAPLWDQIARAHHTLGDPRLRAAYDATLSFLDGPAALRGRKTEELDAEAAFARGQYRLGAGNIFAAVSDFALAARRRPDHPDFEAWAAWARVVAEEKRGGDIAATAARERRSAEVTMLGRRPRSRGLLALGLLAEAAGDFDAARDHLREAVACDPKLAGARNALARLEE